MKFIILYETLKRLLPLGTCLPVVINLGAASVSTVPSSDAQVSPFAHDNAPYIAKMITIPVLTIITVHT